MKLLKKQQLDPSSIAFWINARKRERRVRLKCLTLLQHPYRPHLMLSNQSHIFLITQILSLQFGLSRMPLTNRTLAILSPLKTEFSTLKIT